MVILVWRRQAALRTSMSYQRPPQPSAFSVRLSECDAGVCLCVCVCERERVSKFTNTQ